MLSSLGIPIDPWPFAWLQCRSFRHGMPWGSSVGGWGQLADFRVMLDSSGDPTPLASSYLIVRQSCSHLHSAYTYHFLFEVWIGLLILVFGFLHQRRRFGHQGREFWVDHRGQGVTMPALSWGGDMLEVIWSSRGIFMNRHALKAIEPLMRGRIGREMPKAVMDLTRLFIPNLLPGSVMLFFRSTSGATI